MNKSPLQLEHYTLADITIKPYEGYLPPSDSRYPSFDDADFGSAVEFGSASRDGVATGSLWGIRLQLTCQVKEGRQFPYQFSVAIAGVLDGSNMPEDSRANLVLVNGTSLLYGALRDEILRLTSRMAHGPLMLPTVQFAHLATSAEGAPKHAGRAAKKKVSKAKA